MARCSSSNSGSLSTRLSSCANYLEAVEELRTKLLHSSPSYLISNPEKLISLVEVAKSTLQSNGVSLHTFSSCPDHLSAYKAAYFGLLLQLQAHSHIVRLGSKDLQMRLNRLLFPLSTQLKVCTKADKQAVCGVKRVGDNYACGSPEMKPAPLTPGSLSGSSPSSGLSNLPTRIRSRSPPVLPPNVMLPPPAPAKRSAPSAKSTAFIPSRPLLSRSSTGLSRPLDRGRSAVPSRRKASHDTVHFKRRHAEPTTPSTAHADHGSRRELYNMSGGSKSRISLSLHDNDSDDVPTDEADSSSSSSDNDDDADSDSAHVVVPARSPLRRSLGIFCTGKGRGAFSGSVQVQRRRPRPSHVDAHLNVQREPREDAMDTDP